MRKIYATIAIQWDDIYDEVRKLTGYTGFKSSMDGSEYKKLGVKESQYDLLERFWNEASSNVSFAVRRYLKKETTIELGVKLELEMPSNWQLGLKESLDESVRSYFVNYITSKWLRVADHSEGVENKPEPKYMDDATQHYEKISTILNTRRRPERPKSAWSCGCDNADVPDANAPGTGAESEGQEP